MASKVIWNESAIRDLCKIADYIGDDSPDYAETVADEILKLAEGLAGYPHLGRMVPEYGRSEIRERLAYSYRMIYRVDKSIIRILAVVNSARRLPADIDENQKT